jgi:hypothetical protein
MVASFLTDETIVNGKTREQIIKCLEINEHLTSCYMLQVATVQDIKGKTSADSGWYIILEGTRCGKKFFVNNDMKVVRKPNKNKVTVAHEYSLYNCGKFHEGFWMKNF